MQMSLILMMTMVMMRMMMMTMNIGIMQMKGTTVRQTIDPNKTMKAMTKPMMARMTKHPVIKVSLKCAPIKMMMTRNRPKARWMPMT